MIGKLSGVVDSVGETEAIVDVGGVGYVVACSARTLRDMRPGEPARLLIETQMREDAIRLYGFRDAGEKAWFGHLQSVQGVGAKLALGVLSAFAPDELARAVAAQDKAMLARAPGVGQKLAQRIAAELKDKAGQVALGPAAADVVAVPGAAGDAVSALVNLGYRRAEAFAAVAKATQSNGNASVAELIRAGLRELGR
ncbi:Holliday junction branch migration protein RuvA [Desertibaculum subflavum]|uniref:Holliday junction branch migration protein RuvA n=1 Tax=Desertibaculum subflavum TaxID=2268458 RepID=UPI000E65EF38